MVADNIYNSSSRGSDPLSSGLSQHQAPMLVHLHRCHKSHTQKKKFNLFLKEGVTFHLIKNKALKKKKQVLKIW